MPVVWIPALLRDMTGGEAAVTVPGETVGQVIDHLDEWYPGIKSHLCRGNRLRPTIAVAVDGEVRRSGLQQRLAETSEICFLPALSGGMTENQYRTDDPTQRPWASGSAASHSHRWQRRLPDGHG